MPDDDAYREFSSEEERAIQNCPQADSVRVFFCHNPNCHRPHVVLIDDDGRFFAQFVMPDRKPDGSGFLKDLMDACYQSAVMRGERDES